MTATSDYEQALAIIRRLDRQSRARLVAQVVLELADEREGAELPKHVVHRVLSNL